MRPLGYLLQPNHSHVNCIAFSPDSKYLVYGTYKGRRLANSAKIGLWEIATGKHRQLEGHDDWISSLAFSPDGAILASSSYDRRVILWDLKSGKPIRSFLDTGPMLQVLFSPHGHTMVAAGTNGVIRLWDLSSLKDTYVCKLPFRRTIKLHFLPDGRLLSAGHQPRVAMLYEVAADKATSVSPPQNKSTHTIAFSSDHKLLAWGSWDSHIGLWDLDKMQQVHLIKSTGTANALAFSPNNQSLVAGTISQKSSKLKMWNLQSKKRCAMHIAEPGVSSLAFSPDGRILAVSRVDGVLSLWEPL